MLANQQDILSARSRVLQLPHQSAGFFVGVGLCADWRASKLRLSTASPQRARLRSSACIQPGMAQAQAQAPPQQSSLLEQWDRSLSLAAYNKLGTRLPRSFLLLFEHGGNGLFWIPGARVRPPPPTPWWSPWRSTVDAHARAGRALTVRRLRCSGAGAVAAWALPSLGPAMRMCVANLLLGFVLDLIMVGTVKGLVRRGRPVYNKEGDFVLVVSVDKFSFPSGHSSRCASRGLLSLPRGCSPRVSEISLAITDPSQCSTLPQGRMLLFRE